MPKFLEEKLKREYGANSKIPYMVMNKSAQCEATKKQPRAARWSANTGSMSARQHGSLARAADPQSARRRVARRGRHWDCPIPAARRWRSPSPLSIPGS